MVCMRGNSAAPTYTLLPSTSTITLQATPSKLSTPHLTFRMANRGYDVVVDVDTEVGFAMVAQFTHSG